MEQMKEIIKNQNDIGNAMLNKYEIFLKEGKRLSKLDCLEKWRRDLNNLWPEFEANNQQLTELAAGADEPYSKDDYYGYIKMVHDDMVN